MRGGARALLVGTLVIVVTAAGCPSNQPPDIDPVQKEAQLAFLSPLNNATLTQADDLDGNADGIQINVRVLVDPDKAVPVKLFVDDVEVASADAKDGRARFTNVTLSASPEGLSHTLRAEAAGYKPDSVTVTARENVFTPSCEMVAPLGSTLESPFAVTVACVNVNPNEPASLRVFDVNDAQVGPAYTGTLDGNRRFHVNAVNLGAGSYLLRFALDDFPEVVVEKAITVEEPMVLPDPVCTITAPTPDAPPTSSPGFSVTVECVNVPEGAEEVTVTLDGPTTDPVSFTRALVATGGAYGSVVPVVAAEPGLTEIRAELTDLPASGDSVTVEVPAFPVCDAEIRQPADGATNLIDVDLEEPGNQITVVVGAVGDPGVCAGAAVELVVNDGTALTGVLSGNEAQSGTASFVVTVPEGPSEIRATITLHDNAGETDTVSIVFTSPAVGARLVGIPECAGFGDGCFNLSHPNQGAGPAYQRTLTAEAAAINGACPFTAPVLDVEGGAQGIQADDSGSGPWTLADGRCTATFSLVTLHADESPDGVVKTLTLTTGLVGGDAESRDFELGLDRVAPTLTWTTPEGALFGQPDDANPATATIEVTLGAVATGMQGRGIALVRSEDQANVLATCVPDASGICAFELSLADGAHELDVIGADAAGNALVNDTLTVHVDSNGPCVASITLTADANQDDTLNAAEGTVTDVVVTFHGGACAVEDGRPAELVSGANTVLASASTAGNAVTFTGVDLSEGLHTLRVDVTDLAGNAVATADNARQVTVDVTPPTCAFVAPSTSALDTSHDEDASAIGLQVTARVSSDGEDVEIRLNGAVKGAGAPTGGSFAVANITVPNGDAAFSATCVDAAGNTASASLLAVADADGPTVAWGFVTPTVRLTRNANDGGADLGPLDASNTPGYQAVLQAVVDGCDGNPVVVTAGGAPVNDGAPPTAGANPVNLPVSIPDGAALDLVVSCTDDLGLVGAARVEATVDTVPPAAPADLTAVLNADPLATRLGWVDIDFTVLEEGLTYDVVASHADVTNFDVPDPTVPFVAFSLPTNVEPPVTTGADGLPALWFGPQTWTIALRVKDGVGNVAEDLGKATVSFNLLARNIQHVDEEGGVVDRFGWIVSTTRGDLNNDGYDDFVVSAYQAGSDCAGTRCNGALFVMYGGPTSELATRDWHRIDGLPEEILGRELAIVPSINDDDVSDLLVGALHEGVPAVYVYFGTTDGSPLAARPDYIVTDSASANLTFGTRLAGVGDVNGDGIGDWIAADHGLGAAPKAYLFFGAANLETQAEPYERADLAAVTLNLPQASGVVPSGFAALGNLNGDTANGVPLDDFAVGAADAAIGNRVFVLHGRTAWPSSLSLPDDLVAPDVALAPSAAFGTRFGVDVSGGDVNGDGSIDLIVKGQEHVVVFLNTGAGFSGTGSYRLRGGASIATGRTGISVGDINGDGYADVMLSSDAAAWVYLGNDNESVNREIPDIRSAFTAPVSPLVTVLNVGDIDGDGFDDVAYSDRQNEMLYLRYGP